MAAGPDPEPTLSTRLALALLVLAWGPAMAFQFGHIGALASLRLDAAPGSVLATLLPQGGLPLLTLAQVLVILAAGVFAAGCLAGIRGTPRRGDEPYSRAGWRALLSICALYEIVVLAFAIGILD